MNEIDLHGLIHTEAVDRAEDFVLNIISDGIYQLGILVK
mgnify:CR=1 FL=1